MNTKSLFLGAAIATMVSASHAETPTTEVICSYAPSQSAMVNKITAAAGGAGAGASAILSATGLQFVAHSGGGYILTGSGGYVAGTLLSTAVVVPATIFTVAAGTGVFLLELSCAPINHPQAVSRVREITDAFNEEVRAANQEAIKKRDAAWSQVKELNKSAIVTRDAAISQAQEANQKAIVIRDRVFAGIFN